MTFKLSAQLDDVGDPNLPFKLYESYIQHNKRHFPDGVLKIIAHPDWSGGSASKAPYYSRLDSFALERAGDIAAQLKVTLVKEMYVEKPFKIEITYKGLSELDIPRQRRIDSELIWRYEQFLFVQSEEKSINKEKAFTHQIEWVDGTIWSISAKDLEVQWETT